MGAHSKIVVTLVAAGVSTLLHGCGGGGGSDPTPAPTASPTEAPVPTAAPTAAPTTVPIPPRTPPQSAASIVNILNVAYKDFEREDPYRQLGVTIHMASNTDTFYGNMWCSTFENSGYEQTGCLSGMADCHLSASLYSHKWTYNKTSKVPMMMAGRQVGFVFNQTMVEQRWAKCAYIWDGASSNRYNRGCGLGADGGCTKNTSAWKNICPTTKKECTAEDAEIQRAICKEFNKKKGDNPGGDHIIPATHGNHSQCLFRAPALDYHGQVAPEAWNALNAPSDLFAMAKARVDLNDGEDDDGPNVEKWNEIVLDEKLLLPDIWNDPAVAVPAFVYTKSKAPISKTEAEKAMKNFKEVNKLEFDVPLVMINDVDPKTGNIFELHTAEIEV